MNYPALAQQPHILIPQMPQDATDGSAIRMIAAALRTIVWSSVSLQAPSNFEGPLDVNVSLGWHRMHVFLTAGTHPHSPVHLRHFTSLCRRLRRGWHLYSAALRQARKLIQRALTYSDSPDRLQRSQPWQDSSGIDNHCSAGAGSGQASLCTSDGQRGMRSIFASRHTAQSMRAPGSPSGAAARTLAHREPARALRSLLIIISRAALATLRRAGVGARCGAGVRIYLCMHARCPAPARCRACLGRCAVGHGVIGGRERRAL
ncbi:hypothetical protein HYPSUDRAFT_542644 [Hypholoma sublateritium FD-334 SS-4]|uniref:Uncharacterized protein n=1 Tax=Hypholoma sublateritium (strain FD-334 SS-4) TaxID=945553 RepID=A0A0D2KGG6_HYPSF|nr:hypothetical protein HYPSUDRAFT_542644 [Hypholoma sublateritium FD-334 SS-4]